VPAHEHNARAFGRTTGSKRRMPDRGKSGRLHADRQPPLSMRRTGRLPGDPGCDALSGGRGGSRLWRVCGTIRGVDVVFVHGAGRQGADAWPRQAAVAQPGWFFLPRAGVTDDAVQDAERVLGWLRARGGGHVVGHSYGANAALLAAQLESSIVLSLTLLEPACFDVARGMPAVEEHIAAMTPVFAVADDTSVSGRDFSRRFAAGMGMEPPDLPEEELQASVCRLRALRPPWGVGLRPQERLPARTLVVTGGWSPLYEETAKSLVASGARHLTLEGAGHRVQDDPRATQLLRNHWSH
jgi:pimeloyl-ACP methyl ester carboxylesterase